MLRKRIQQAAGQIPADRVIRSVRIFDLVTGSFAVGDIAVADGVIVGCGDRYDGAEIVDGDGMTAVPGFFDTHVHLESSLMTPFHDEETILRHGVTTAVCDPHELCNVFGTKALDYFLAASERMAMDLFVTLPGCVPATPFETSGAVLTASELAFYRNHPRVLGLAEMMNIPGVLGGDEGVLDKLLLFYGGNIDGHAPMVGGKALAGLLCAGIGNCHETDSLEEGREKLRKGMTLLVREGSAARNLETLLPLLTPATSPFIAFCSDDRNPQDLELGSIDFMVRYALEAGADPLAVYRASSLSGARAFRLFDRGLIAPGYKADFLLLDSFERCSIHTVYKAGRPVGDSCFAPRPAAPAVAPFLNSVRSERIIPEKLAVFSERAETPVIEVADGTLITGFGHETLTLRNGEKLISPERDILKCTVVERHGWNGNIGLGFVRGFGLKAGAFASSIGHDSHNLCAVGCSDAEIAFALNALIETGGGFAVVKGGELMARLSLPVGGLMTDASKEEVLQGLDALAAAAKMLGCPMHDPLQALAFLPLTVIPHLRISDRGLFDAVKFEFIRP